MNYNSTAYTQDGDHYAKEHHTYEPEPHYSAAEMEEYEHDEHVQPAHPPSESEGTPDSPQYDQGGGDQYGYGQDNRYYQQQQEVIAPAEDDQAFEAPVSAGGFVEQPRPSVDILPSLDITYELKFIKERLATIARDDDPEEEPERQALLEIERSTEALIASRKVLSERQRQLAFMDAGDSKRPALQAEVTQLMSESKYKERQWTANKEAYYREFSSGTAVVITQTTASVGLDGIPEPIAAAPRKLSPAEAEMKARVEKDIRVLQDQIASLKKQLDAVATRRRQMAVDAEEYRRRMEY